METEILYKYRILEQHRTKAEIENGVPLLIYEYTKSIFEKGELYFRNPNNFNDPCDFKIPYEKVRFYAKNSLGKVQLYGEKSLGKVRLCVENSLGKVYLMECLCIKSFICRQIVDS